MLRRCLVACVLAVASIGSAAIASEADLHFYGIYAVGVAAGLSESDALLIAKASQSLDENAETSPIPDTAKIKDHWYWERAALWHSLPPPVAMEEPAVATEVLAEPEDAAIAYKQMVQRRLVELSDRARDAKDPETSKIYFGEYLHALADSITHDPYLNIIGHAVQGHKPDIPGPERRKQTGDIVRLLIGAVARYQTDTLHEKPRPVATATVDAMVNALTLAAPSGQEPIASRSEVARQQLQREFRQRQIVQSIPKWCSGPPAQCDDTSIKPLALDVDGNVKKGVIIPPTDWEKAFKTTTDAARTAATKAVLNTLGMANADLGGIDFTAVHLHYISDVAAGDNARLFRASFAPEVNGASAPEGVSLMAFAAALMLPDRAWWVNLNPNEPERIIDPMLGRTDVGRALLEADLLLKRVMWEALDPATESGKKYWAEKVGGALLPEKSSLWRVWIVPGDCTARTAGAEIEIADCVLDVRINLENLLLDLPASPDKTKTQMNAELGIKYKYIVPALIHAVNHDARFAELRSIYRARAMAGAYKERFRKTGALSHLIDSLRIQTLPQPVRRDPRAIWAEFVRDIETTPGRFVVPVPGTDGMRVWGGGIVFDKVDITAAGEQRLMTLRPPMGLGEGILVATVPAQRVRSKRHPYLEAALQAYQRSGPDTALAAAAELMPALALFGDMTYARLRPKIAAYPDTDIWLDFADALKNSEDYSKATPLQLLAFAIWSRVHSSQAVAAFQGKRKDPLRLLIYLLAAQASPRAGDPRPEQLNSLLDTIVRSSPAQQVELLSNTAAIASFIAPRSTKRMLEQLLVPRFSDKLSLNADAVMLACESFAAVDAQLAARVLAALRVSFEKSGQQPPEGINALAQRIQTFTDRLANAQNASDPFAQIQLARFEWLSHPAEAVKRAKRVVESSKTGLSLKDREELIVKALPLLSTQSTDEAFALADSLNNQPLRMIAFSWLAIQSFDASAADALLNQRIILEGPDWMH